MDVETFYCVVLDVGDEDVIDVRVRTTIVCENRQLRAEKKELVAKNDSLTKEKKDLNGDRLLRIGYEMKEGGGERVSVM